MSERARRVGLNEALFRDVNERLQDLNETFGAITGNFTIMCECGNLACDERLAITPSAYQELRAEPTLFAVAPGHEIVEVEEVVTRCGSYDVVKKRPGEPERVARATDPRS